MNRRYRLFFSFACIVGLAGAAPAARAYVPPSEFIVKQLAQKHKGYKSLKIRTLVTGMKGDVASGTTFKNISYFSYRSGVLRSYAVDDQGHNLYVTEQHLTDIPIAQKLLLNYRIEGLEKDLKAADVPIKTSSELAALQTEDERRAVEVSSIHRWPPGPPGPSGQSGSLAPSAATDALSSSIDTVAWVIGMDGQKRSGFQPELWVQKDQFIPLRLFVQLGGQTVDVRYDAFRYIQEFPYPKTVSLTLGDSYPSDQVMQEQLLELAVNADVSDLKDPVTTGFTDYGNEADSGLRKLIQAYYQYIR